MKKINTKIRKKIYWYEWPAAFEWFIYSHKENCDNNGDKFLIHMRCFSQSFMVWGWYNDEDYNLPLLKDQEDIVFVVCWNREIQELLHFFRNIRIHAR